MAAPRTKAAAQTLGREPPPPRMAERTEPTRDPNVITTRDGRPVDLQRIATQNEDRFDLARMGIFAPQGWVYEWRVRTVKNQEWTDSIVEDAQKGWTPVPAERHDGKIMPKGYKGTIERGGLQLMERDARLTAMSRDIDKRAANQAVKDARDMAGLMGRAAPNAGAITDFGHGEAQRVTGVKVDRQARVPDANYSYTLDE